jgi:hypothetical protein
VCISVYEKFNNKNSSEFVFFFLFQHLLHGKFALIVAACDGLIAQYFILKTFGCFSLADLPPLPLLLPTEKEEKKACHKREAKIQTVPTTI